MTYDNITTVIIAILLGTAFYFPIAEICKALFTKVTKITATSKTGEIVELDLEKDTDVETVMNFLDVYLGRK